MGEGIPEHQQKQNEHIRDIEDLAHLKSAIYTATEPVFNNLAETHALDDFLIRRFRESIKEALIKSNFTGEDELQAIASQALNQTLEKFNIEKPGLARDFQKNLRSTMDAHFSK